MITLWFYMTVKVEQVNAFLALIPQLVRTTHAEDDGCITYVFHQQRDNPHDFVLYEQWRDQAAVEAHFARLDRTIGITELFDYFTETRVVEYDVVA